MTDTLAHFLRALITLGILLAAARVMLLRERARPRRLLRKPRPTGQGRQDLARLLAASTSSTYSRDRVQERLRLVAEDLTALDRSTTEAPRLQEQWLIDYFAEDHVGFRGGAQRPPSQDPDFLRRTEAVLDQLEHHRPDAKGDRP